MPRSVGGAPTRTYRAGEVIFREGDDPGGEVYLIHAGRVEVRKRVGDEERSLRVLGPGELLGEQALFREEARRSATAVAVDSVTLVVIPALKLDRMVRSNPLLAVALIRQLASRLREAEDREAERTGARLSGAG